VRYVQNAFIRERVELAQRENGSAGRIIELKELKAGRRDLLRLCDKSLFVF
jgi:hypothetical protein